MDDLDVLARDFGYRPQGKSAPMRSTGASSSSPIHDVFGGASKSTADDFDYDSIFKASDFNNNDYSSSSRSRDASKKTSDFPVFDKPVYDDDGGGDDIFEGLPGTKSKSSSKGVEFGDGDVFGSSGASGVDHFDELLGNFGRNQRNVGSMEGMDDFLGGFSKNEEVKSSGRSGSLRDFDDLLGGFGSESSGIGNRPTNVSPHPPKQTSPMDNPFVVLDSTSPVSSSSGVFIDPLKDMSNLGKLGKTKVNTSSMSGGSFSDIDPLNGFNKSVPPFSPDTDGREKDWSPSKSRSGFSGEHASVGRKETSSFRYSESHSQKKVPVDSFQESPLFDIPSVSTDSKNSYGQNVSSPPQYSGTSHNEKNFQADVSPTSEELSNSSGDVWLSVSEVPLFTQPTKSPPPSRPPPPIPRRTSKAESGYFSSSTRRAGEDYPPSYSSYTDSPKPRHPEENKSSASQIDDLEDFAMDRSQNNVHPGEDMDAAAAAMKEAMDRAEAKFKHAKEVRDREHAKAAKSKESFYAEKDEQTMQEAREREYRENQERLERERRQKEQEEEREQRRLEKERTERERARQAVERATREARERAAADARERASAEARLRAERAAVGKAQAEARERAGKAAVQRVQAEARERAAAEAKERAEKAAAEAREKSTLEAREREAKEKAEAQRRSQRAAVERAAAEARERAAADARERAANAARASQQKNENDLESFFSSRPSSVPKARTSSSDPFFDQFQNKGGSDSSKRTPSTGGPTSNIKKTSSATNIVDDLSSIFGAPSSSGNFQDIEGETEERRRARLERHQRTQERAAKALAEKNERDMQVQRDQEERNRVGETLDFEVKRWAAGKEGNLRALLSTLQYVLWPECGWQPVSLTDLITGASVKKVYRKATLCIHPDKVQQKGATLQQKYIAEKVFDLLKEAWNKFNSEELF